MDRQLAERMVGAACLLAILVLVVPAVLDGNGDPEPGRLAPTGETAVDLRTHTIRLQTGEREPPVPVPRVTPDSPAPTAGPLSRDEPSAPPATALPGLAAEEPEPPASAVSTPGEVAAGTPAPAVAPAPAEIPPAAPLPPARSAPTPTLTSTTAPPPASAPTPAAGGWFVQLGSFAQRGNAERLAGELGNKGFSAQVMPGGGGSGSLFRVRAGPVADRAAAEELAARLGRAGYPGQVVR